MTDKWVTVPVAWLESLREALDEALGDTDICWDQDEVKLRDVNPVLWCCYEISVMLTAAPKFDELTCVWKVEDADDGVWSSSCGEEWQFTGDGPLENEMNYCPYCGGQLLTKEGVL